MSVIEREKLRQLVNDWADGLIAVEDVHEQAEAYWQEYDQLELSKDDPNSIPVEVLSQLEILNHQLITRDDAPAILEFLDVPLGSEREGWKVWRSYWDGLDYDARKLQLKQNEYYIT